LNVNGERSQELEEWTDFLDGVYDFLHAMPLTSMTDCAGDDRRRSPADREKEHMWDRIFHDMVPKQSVRILFQSPNGAAPSGDDERIEQASAEQRRHLMSCLHSKYYPIASMRLCRLFFTGA
jgi:hypothetical protein